MRKLVLIKMVYLIIKARFLRFFFLSTFLMLVNPVKALERDTIERTTEEIKRERQVLEAVVTGDIPDRLRGVLEPIVKITEGGESAVQLGEDYYIGLLVTPHIVDREGMGSELRGDSRDPGLSFGISDVEDVGGDEAELFETLIIGKELRVNGVPVKFDVDSTNSMVENTEGVIFGDLDENPGSGEKWQLVTARAGLEKKWGLATFFANGGLAVARFNSAIDISLKEEESNRFGNSSGDHSFRLGWVVGLGMEIPLNKRAIKNIQGNGAWLVQMEMSHVSLAEEAYTIGSSGGGGHCGSRGIYRPCFSNITDDMEVTLARVVLIRRFSW